MNQKEFRDQVLAKLVEVFTSYNYSEWKKNWKAISISSPYNGGTKAKYKGINQLNLALYSMEKGYSDPRWYTMLQIQDVKGYVHKGQKWHLKKGSKGVVVEYWFPYNTKTHKMATWEEYGEAQKKGETEDYTLRSRYSYVFNASQIEGIPALKKYENLAVECSDAVKKLAEGMKVEVLNDGQDRAYYSPSEDKFHLPDMSAFSSSEAYNLTALHELIHSTGHSSRLNRDLTGGFGTDSYAKEELVAEIASVLSSSNITTDLDYCDIDNHKAYIKSWSKQLMEQPKLLSEAVKLAQQAAEYVDSFLQTSL